MTLDAKLLNKVATALTEGRAATREDLMQNYPTEITVTDDYQGYLNPRVTAIVDQLSGSHVTHVKFIPLREDGYVIVVPAVPDEPGATELVRSKSLRTGTVPMRVALRDFALEFPSGRKLKFPVYSVDIELPTATESSRKLVLLVRVKQIRSRNIQVRTRKTPALAAAKGTAGKETGTGEQPPGETQH